MQHDPRHDAQMLALLRQRRAALRAAGLPATAGMLCEAMALQLDPDHVRRLIVIDAMQRALRADGELLPFPPAPRQPTENPAQAEA